jgi:predicted ATPase/DNA-binding XRE family transcriptional regulator
VSVDRISPLSGASFGALLRRYREAAGLTQEELAQRAGLSVRGISDLERGLRQAPRRDTVEMLADALSLPPHQRALFAAAARPSPQGIRLQNAPPTPHNLPAQLAPLLGRERETQQAVELLGRADVRLLTLTGPGGVGKTRLALAVAEGMLGHGEDGVYLVQLASLRDPALALERLADAIGLRVAPRQPLAEQIHSQLHDRRMLLVLDNFEHLLAAAPQVAALLAACPQVKALVTSREPLKLAGEHELPIAPLAQDAAIQLFLERAQAARPEFAPTSADRPLIAAICQRIDHLPLAIELAASWVRTLSLATLLERLERRLELLSAGRRDAPERQRTLRGAIAWSVDLLEPHEQRVFRRLAVFVGGCALDAAEEVCGDFADDRAGTDGAEGSDSPAEASGAATMQGETLDGLARLVEKSLLQAEMLPEGTRFTMLETLREYAHERLVASGEAEALERRHAEYYARLAAELGWIGAEQDTRDRRLEHELPNARAALTWAVQRHEPMLGLKLATPLGRWWYSRGAFEEGEGWLRTLLALDAQAGVHAAPPPLRGAALYALILFALDRHDYAEAEAMAQEGLALARQYGDAARAGNMLAELGHVAEARGDLDAAMTYFEQGLAQYQQGGEGGAIGRTLSSLGNLARAQGDYPRARDYLEQALAWARSRDFGFAIASALVSLGHVACEQGDYARASPLSHESLSLYQTLRNPASLTWCLAGVAVTRAAVGEHAAAARLCGAIASLRASASIASVAWAPFSHATEAAQRALGEAPFADARAGGGALSAEQAIAYALEVTAPPA